MDSINVYTIYQKRERKRRYDFEEDTVTFPRIAADVVDKAFNLSHRTTEHFGVLCLNTKNQPVGVHLLSTGSLNMCVINPRDVFQAALLNNAKSVILFHNHPSGQLEISEQDVEATIRMMEAGNLMDIQVMDHVIVSSSGFTSLKTEKRM